MERENDAITADLHAWGALYCVLAGCRSMSLEKHLTNEAANPAPILPARQGKSQAAFLGGSFWGKQQAAGYSQA